VNRLNYSYCKESSPDASLVREFLIHLVRTLGHSEQWMRRQAFASLAGQLVEIGAMSPAQFAQDILPHLINLSEDPVPNVRLVVAQSLTYHIMPIGEETIIKPIRFYQMNSLLQKQFVYCVFLLSDYFSDPNNPHKEILLRTLSSLQEDSDSDVRYYSRPVNEDDDDDVAYLKSC
jgi:serine/threonine-protein phosphatase 4 regulatory subunit 1